MSTQIVTGVDFVSIPTQDLDQPVQSRPDGDALMLHHRYVPRVPGGER